MKKFSIYALALALGAMTFTSCEDAFGDFLNKQPSNELTKGEVLGDWALLVQFHNDTYNFLRHGALRINRSWLDAATDLAESSIQTSGTRTTLNIKVRPVFSEPISFGKCFCVMVLYLW